MILFWKKLILKNPKQTINKSEVFLQNFKVKMENKNNQIMRIYMSYLKEQLFNL
jgi:hypothetical protein